VKIFVCSDIHGNARALQAVLAVYRAESPCEFLFLGDCVGYGAHPDACLDIVSALPRATLVLGNHDAALLDAGERREMNEIAAEAIGWAETSLGGRYDDLIRRRFRLAHEDGRYLAVHASPFHPEEWPYLFGDTDVNEAFLARDFTVCFAGHTHVPALHGFAGGERPLVEGTMLSLDSGNRWIVNPGSVGQPRDGDPRAACCVFDPAAGTIVHHRCEYDVEAEAADIVAAGLPRALAERLLVGM